MNKITLIVLLTMSAINAGDREECRKHVERAAYLSDMGNGYGEAGVYSLAVSPLKGAILVFGKAKKACKGLENVPTQKQFSDELKTLKNNLKIYSEGK